MLLANGQPYEAKFIASDANYDLAVLKIDGENLPTAEFLDSDTLQVGNAVYAIGTPLDRGDERHLYQTASCPP